MSDLGSFFEGKTQEEWADEAGSTEIFPPGWHRFTVIKTNGPKPNKNENGQLLEVHFEHENGGKLRNWYNLAHANETAATIGRAELAKLFSSAGRKIEKGTASLPGAQVDLRLTIEKNTYTTSSGEHREGENNSVKDSAPAGAESSKKRAIPAQQQQAGAGTDKPSGGNPW